MMNNMPQIKIGIVAVRAEIVFRSLFLLQEEKHW